MNAAGMRTCRLFQLPDPREELCDLIGLRTGFGLSSVYFYLAVKEKEGGYSFSVRTITITKSS